MFIYLFFICLFICFLLYLFIFSLFVNILQDGSEVGHLQGGFQKRHNKVRRTLDLPGFHHSNRNTDLGFQSSVQGFPAGQQDQQKW